jgi:hypothetical protein
MKRIQLFEFEDFRHLPSSIRSTMTKLIVVLQKGLKIPELIAELFAEVHQQHPFSQIVDLGSGSGGVIPEAVQLFNAQRTDSPVHLLLTDLYPDSNFVNQFNNQQFPNQTYLTTSINATDSGNSPRGLKTMFNSFHHMPPKAAQTILQNAQTHLEPILIYEMAENTIPLFLWWVLLPLSLPILILMTLFMLPFVKPLGLKDLLFTYLIPIVPIVYAWDGQASLPRMYTFYHWKMEPVRNKNGKKSGYYLLGLPISNKK